MGGWRASMCASIVSKRDDIESKGNSFVCISSCARYRSIAQDEETPRNNRQVLGRSPDTHLFLSGLRAQLPVNRFAHSREDGLLTLNHRDMMPPVRIVLSFVLDEELATGFPALNLLRGWADCDVMIWQD